MPGPGRVPTPSSDGRTERTRGLLRNRRLSLTVRTFLFTSKQTRGPTNTEPGAVATGSYEAWAHRDCKFDKMGMSFIVSSTRSLPLPVLYSLTHDANRPSPQILI